MKKTIQRIGVISAALLTLAISANAQWTETATSVYLTNGTKPVGIGTNSPGYPLDIKQQGNCNFRVQSLTSGSSNMILARSPLAGTNCLVNYKTGTTTLWYTGVTGANDDFRIRNTAFAEKFFIGQTSGRMGFNTATPAAPFDFNNGGYNNTTSDGCMSVGTSNGYHLALDNNEIQSRSNSTGGNNILFLNYWGGDINMNYYGGNTSIGDYLYGIARLEVGGALVGNTAASFGTGQTGISLVASYPGVYYNSYYNGGGLAMAAGYSGNCSLDPGNGNFAWSVSTSAATATGEAAPTVNRLAISQGGTMTLNPSLGYDGIVINDPGDGNGFFCNKSGFNYGIYMNKTSTSSSVPSISAYCTNSYGILASTSNSGSYAGYFSGNVFTTGSYLPSDQNLKQNVKVFTGGLDVIKNLPVKTYDYKTEGLMGKMNLPLGNQVGIMAQDLEKEMPQLVKQTNFWEGNVNHELKEGEGQTIDFKAVNYTGLVPVLVQAVKELNEQNQKLADRVDVLETALSQCCAAANRAGNTDNSITAKSSIQQNQPNPFNKTSVINYELKTGDNSGKVVIRDINGNMVREFVLAQSGKGQLTINANQLVQGTYTYTLEINGVTVDTKLMVVTK